MLSIGRGGIGALQRGLYVGNMSVVMTLIPRCALNTAGVGIINLVTVLEVITVSFRSS